MPINCSGGRPTEIGERTIDAKNVVLFIVHHDEVADGVKDFHPVPVRLLNAGEEAGIFKGDAGVACDGAHQLAIVGHRGRAAVGKTEKADEFARRARQTNERAIGPPHAGGESGAEQIGGRRKRDIGGVFGQRCPERPSHAVDQNAVLDVGAAGQEHGLRFRGLEKAERGAAGVKERSGAERKVTHELRQLENRIEFERDRD